MFRQSYFYHIFINRSIYFYKLKAILEKKIALYENFPILSIEHHCKLDNRSYIKFRLLSQETLRISDS